MLDLPFSNGNLKTYSNAFRPDLMLKFQATSATTGIINVYMAAPSISSCSFDNSGSNIVITFNTGIQLYNIAGDGSPLLTTSSYNCNTAMITDGTGGTATLNRPGYYSDCQLLQTNANTVTLTLSSLLTGSNIPIVTSLIVFLPGGVTANYPLNADAFSGTFSISAPATALTPIVTIFTKKTVGPCDNVVFDLSQVSNAGGRPFLTISSTTAMNGVANAGLTTIVNNALQNFLTGSLAISIDQSNFTPATYTFTITVQNFLGHSGSGTVTVTKSNSNDVWGLQLSGPSKLISAGYQNQLIANVTTPQQCSGQAAAQFNLNTRYSWCMTSAPVGFNLSVISGTSANQLTLVIPPYTLTPLATFTFQFTINYSGTVKATDTILVSTNTDTMWINGGSSLYVSQTSPIVITMLYGSDSYMSVASAIFVFQWSCLTSTGKVCFDLKTSKPLNLYQMTTATVNLTGSLAPGIYQFTASVYNSATGSKATTGTPKTVYVLSTRIPSAALVLTTTNPSANTINFAISISVDPTTISSANTLLSYEFSSSSDCGDNNVYSVVDVTNTSIVSTSYTSSTLKFLPGVLNPGSSYCIKATVFDPLTPTLIGQAETTFSVRAGPRSGSCSLTTPSTGTAAFSEFGISCVNWVTDVDAYPLFFSLERQNSDGSWSLVSPLSIKSVLKFTLTDGSYNVRIGISDTTSAKSYAPPIQLRVLPNTPTGLAEAEAYLQQIETQYSIDNDGITAIKKLAFLGPLLTSLEVSGSESVRANIFQFTGMVLNQGSIYVDPSSWGRYIPDLLHTFGGAAPIDFNSTAQDLIIDTVITVISQAKANAAASGACIDSDSAVKLYQVLSNGVIGGSLITKTPASSINSKLNTAIQLLENCIHNSMACGEQAVNAVAQDMSRVIGTTASGVKPPTSFCGFNIPNIAASTNSTSSSINKYSSCFRYACGTQSLPTTVNLTAPGSNISFVSGQMVGMVFYDQSTGKELAVNTTTQNSITFTMNIDVLTQQYLFNNPSLNPGCTYIDPDSGLLNTTGCTAIAYTSTTITCNCTHLTRFVASAGVFNKLIAPAYKPPNNATLVKPYPYQMGSPPATTFYNNPIFAFFAPFTVIFLFGLIGLSVYYYKVKPESKKRRVHPEAAEGDDGVVPKDTWFERKLTLFNTPIPVDVEISQEKRQVIEKMIIAIKRFDKGENPVEIDESMEIIPKVGPLYLVDHVGIDMMFLVMTRVFTVTHDARYKPPHFMEILAFKTAGIVIFH